MFKYLRRFPIPPRFRPHIKWVNGIPHFSKLGARTHENQIIKLGKHVDLSGRVYDWLKTAGVDRVEEYYARYKLDGPLKTFNRLSQFSPAAIKSQKFMMHKIDMEELRWKQDPTLAHTDYVETIKILNKEIASISHDGLRDFESKSLLKYASDTSKRNFEGYVAQVSANYVPERPAFVGMRVPNIEAYETALKWQYDMFKCELSETEKFQRLIDRGDFIKDSRHDTFGGPPFYHNMGDFISNKDDGDLTTWSDLYNEIAIMWLFLPTHYKIKIRNSYVYTALERVQPGGIATWLDSWNDIEDIVTKDNKQRFVQAETAMLTKGMKPMHDVMLDVWREHPMLAADKYSEEATSDAMKDIARSALELDFEIQGADYTNFDAQIEISELNDAYGNVVRDHFPKWFNSYIVDPYFTLAFTSQTFVKGVGLFVATGIKSGMVITNQGDCFDANFCDLYEIARYAQSNAINLDTALDDKIIRLMIKKRMINGDDRFRMSRISVSDVERFDLELGLIAQRSKQESYYPKGKFDDKLKVTYLKTGLFYYNGALIRVDSIAKVILGRYNRERARLEAMPNSFVLDCVMSANRSSEHPYLWLLVSWLVNASDTARDWLDGKLSTEQLLRGAVIEQMHELKRTKGKIWLKKKNISPDDIIDKMSRAYGLSPDGHRASIDYMKVSDRGREQLDFDKLPINQVLFSTYKNMSDAKKSLFKSILKQNNQ